jgi:hypothetical protein
MGIREPEQGFLLKKCTPLLLLSCVLLAACGPDKTIADLPSPGGKHHVEVRECPQAGVIRGMSAPKLHNHPCSLGAVNTLPAVIRS